MTLLSAILTGRQVAEIMSVCEFNQLRTMSVSADKPRPIDPYERAAPGFSQARINSIHCQRPSGTIDVEMSEEN